MCNEKKILLINPYDIEAYGLSHPPLGLLYIAGNLLKHGFDVQIVDGYIVGKEGIIEVMKNYSPHIVGITCLTPGRKKSLSVAQFVKDFNPEIRVILGGVHATIMYGQILKKFSFIDFIVLGEGENTFLELVQDREPSKIKGIAYRNGHNIVKTPNRGNIENLDELPFPAWHLVDLNKYPPLGKGTYRGIDLTKESHVKVVFSRGCSGRCTFCSSWWIWRGWRCRSAKNMADEIELLYNEYRMRSFGFADDSMTVDQNKVISLCDEIIKRKIKIIFQITTRTDCVSKPLLRKLKEAGCYSIGFGIESGSLDILSRIDKKTNLDMAAEAIKQAKKVGLRVNALIMIGNFGETQSTVYETLDFLKRTQPDEVGCVGGLWVFPGTKVYYEMKRNGYIDDDFWLTDEPHMVYTVEHSIEKLGEFEKIMRAYQNRFQRWYSEMKNASKGKYLSQLLYNKLCRKIGILT